MRRTHLLVILLYLFQVQAGLSAEPTNGYKSLFIGHSFFVPMARGMPAHAHRAGFKDHEQVVFFEGGELY